MWKEYSSYLDMYKSNSQSVTRARTMVLIHDMYLQLEQFTFKEAPFIILTVQSSEAFTKKPKSEQMTILKQHLPPLIIDNIVEDITGSFELPDKKTFRIEKIADPKWVLPENLRESLKNDHGTPRKKLSFDGSLW